MSVSVSVLQSRHSIDIFKGNCSSGGFIFAVFTIFAISEGGGGVEGGGRGGVGRISEDGGGVEGGGGICRFKGVEGGGGCFKRGEGENCVLKLLIVACEESGSES